MSLAPSIVWFRQDLRLRDNPALAHALAGGGPIVPVFIWAPDEEGEWAPGAASRWWLHRSLAALDESLRRAGSRLILRRGDTLAELRRLVCETGAGAVAWNRRHEPAAAARDRHVKQALLAGGLDARSFEAALLHPPGRVQSRAGTPFQVFTPFWRHGLSLTVRPEVASGTGPIGAPVAWPHSEVLDDLGLNPAIPWDREFHGRWSPGEAGAQEALGRFLAETAARYAEDRDLPARPATSRLSPHLHFGEIGPVQVWHALRRLPPGSEAGVEAFLREIGWREFAAHLLHHFPQTATEPLRPAFARFPWEPEPARLRAWQRGLTGYPVVDAGMRQLWRTGWMHNRVRMIVASFLVKHLLQPWQDGARWFWDTLVDADLASNTLGWQWSAGCGADAAPYFRVFNPVRQAARFDPDGEYVRAWVPELAGLPARWLHAPWEAPATTLATAGVVLGQTYPRPLVDHATARARALAACANLRAVHA